MDKNSIEFIFPKDTDQTTKDKIIAKVFEPFDTPDYSDASNREFLNCFKETAEAMKQSVVLASKINKPTREEQEEFKKLARDFNKYLKDFNKAVRLIQIS